MPNLGFDAAFGNEFEGDTESGRRWTQGFSCLFVLDIMSNLKFLGEIDYRIVAMSDAEKTVEARKYQTELHCAALVGKIDAAEIEALAEAGYEGVECRVTDVTLEEAREARRICEANGIKIHSVMKGAQFNADDPDQVAEAVKSLKQALRVASAYGASTALVVPGSVAAPALNPWEFNVKFDPETLMVTQVCEGDNAPFADYIAAQNYATTATQKYLPQVLDAAAYEGVKIGLENVWNNLWCDPQLLAAFIRSFDNPWVGSYFDLGNYVKFAPTVEWLRALGKGVVVKLHFKDFRVDRSLPNGGQFVPVGLGSNDWIEIRQTLDDLEYNGFATIEFEEQESTKLSHKQQVQKFRNFFDGVDILRGV